MIIKKFQAATETDAILLAKEELGKDAIVTNIKRSIPKGLFRLFKKPQVEVTAAVDEMKNYTVRKEVSSRNSDTMNEGFHQSYSTSKGQESNLYNFEEKISTIQSLLEEQMEKTKGQAIATSKDGLSYQGETKKEELKKEEPEPESESMACVRLIYNQLLTNEVQERFINQLIAEIESTIKKESSVDLILSGFYQKIILKLGQPKEIEYEEGKTKFIFFVGPTGVGKTTTIAKIASTIKLKKMGKVALLTADTYRVAAVDQLKTYADILDMPLQVIYSDTELEELTNTYDDYDFVLIDTAGRSHKSREQRDDLEHLIKAIPDELREVYLVLSATTKYNDLVKITEVYSDITDYRLIFTKLDETSGVGNILNLRMLTGANLSYVTVGQNVPDDIEKINAQEIARQLLGGNE